jgi:hypothetical protein
MSDRAPEFDFGAPAVPHPAPVSVEPKPPAQAELDLLRHLGTSDRQHAGRMCREDRPLVLLRTPRNRWFLVRPRLPIAGYDECDFAETGEGELFLVIAADVSASDAKRVITALTRSGRTFTVERLGSGLAQLGSLLTGSPL